MGGAASRSSDPAIARAWPPAESILHDPTSAAMNRTPVGFRARSRACVVAHHQDKARKPWQSRAS
jgi:hypothetical protein